MNNRAFENRIILSIVLFMVAFLLRIGLSSTKDVGYVPSDGINYHNIALNIASGNGFSNDMSAPFEQYFFREPMYPLLMSSVYLVFSKCGGQLEYIDYSDNESIRKEMFWLRVFQAFLDSLTCLILFWTFRRVFGLKQSFIAIGLYALYFPIAYYAILPLREMLQQFLMVLLSYLLFQYINTDKKQFFLGVGLIAGMLILTLQTHIMVLPIIALFLLFKHKRIWITIKDSAIILFVIMIVLSPWLIRTYKFYPDFRVLKSVGLSFTHEQLFWQSAVVQARDTGIITSDEMYKKLNEWYAMPEHDKFELSYNGYFNQQSDSLKMAINEYKRSQTFMWKLKYRLKWFAGKAKNSFFKKISLSRTNLESNVNSGRVLSMLPYVIGIIIGVGGLFYLLLSLKRHWQILFPVFFYFPMFTILGSESRRMLVLQTYIFIFFVLGLIHCFSKVRMIYIRKKEQV